MKIANNVTELIGNTPLVKLNRLAAGIDGTIAVKLEFYNPAHSVKDRIAAAMLDGIERGQFHIHFPKRFTNILRLARLLPYRARSHSAT